MGTVFSRHNAVAPGPAAIAPPPSSSADPPRFPSSSPSTRSSPAPRLNLSPSPTALTRARARLEAKRRRARRGHHHRPRTLGAAVHADLASMAAAALVGAHIQIPWPGTAVWVDCHVDAVDLHRAPFPLHRVCYPDGIEHWIRLDRFRVLRDDTPAPPAASSTDTRAVCAHDQ